MGQERGLIGSLFDAANEMGSASQSTEATDKLMGQLGQYNTKVEASLGRNEPPSKALLRESGRRLKARWCTIVLAGLLGAPLLRRPALVPRN